MSIRVVANNYVAEENAEKFMEGAKVMVEKTNALDKGCISYQLCRNAKDPTHFVMIEEWEDQASLEAHIQSEHFQSLIPTLGALANLREEELFVFERIF